METTLNQVSPVEYELTVRATADDLSDQLNDALRKQRKQMDLPGFRQGKVPMQIVKKKYGESIGFEVAQRFVSQTFASTMEEEHEDIEPLGRPEIMSLDYDFEGDLEATVRFGVEPDIELADLSQVTIPMLDHTVSDADVQDEIDQILRDQADLVPAEDAEIGPEDYVDVDLQRVDPSTNTPIIGEKEEGLTFFLDDDWLMDALRDELLGHQAGDTVRVELPSDEGEQHVYDVTINDVKRRELPPFDEAVVREVTDGDLEDPEELREEIHDRLQNAYTQRSRELVEQEIVEQMLDRHQVPVPNSLIESVLDSFVDQVRQQNDGDLPDDFDETHFRQQNRSDAEQQGRWMLLRNHVIATSDLEVTDDDIDAFLIEQAGGDASSVEQMRRVYSQMPRMMERVQSQVMSRKVYDHLLEQMDVDEMDLEAFQEAMEDRHAHHDHAGHDHDHDHAHDAAPTNAPNIVQASS
ncbi:trigger factor [Salisaeta longa]|uniref:trigger factor n=1 Tax=Salisaeta longa TaxID=503170 RepID=UPI0003B5FF14|nr:trigger factor [Salisaeta longa]